MSAALMLAIVAGCSFAAALLVLERRGRAVAVRVAPYVQPVARRPQRRVRRLRITASTRLLATDVVCAIPAGSFALAAGAGAVASLVVAAVAAAAPHGALRLRDLRRRRAFDLQLPDLLDMLASSLRVGHSLEQSLDSAADGAGEPAASELQRALAEIRLGARPGDALGAVGRRVASVDMAYVSVAVEIQQEVGGSLAELLAVVSEAVRERQQFRRKVRAVTGMQRMSAAVLVALPLLAGLVLTVVSPAYMHPLWHTSTGRVLVVVALGMMLTGTLILKRIVAVRS